MSADVASRKTIDVDQVDDLPQLHGSLNQDPFNARAEMLAMQQCMSGLHVRREWTEKEMVKSFGGTVIPGTPDGMFEEWNGDLTCVQVVRVPMTLDMTLQQREDVIYQTVLTKIVKSQHWMMGTRIMPHEFVIFCWCQGWPGTTGDLTEALINRVRKQGWPFVLKLMVPTEPGALFPAKFAYPRAGRQGGELWKHCKYSEADLSTVDPADLDSTDDEVPEWDIFDEEENEESTTTAIYTPSSLSNKSDNDDANSVVGVVNSPSESSSRSAMSCLPD